MGLPAVAAGASGIGTGWDLRQRALGGDAYKKSTEIRRRGSRITHRGLLAVLKRREAEALGVRDRDLSSRLIPGALPVGQTAEWRHHIDCLNQLVDMLTSEAVGRPRVEALRSLYRSAMVDFGTVESLLRRVESGAALWLRPVSDGLDRYATNEDW
jgi:hypothetical protein